MVHHATLFSIRRAYLHLCVLYCFPVSGRRSDMEAGESLLLPNSLSAFLFICCLRMFICTYVYIYLILNYFFSLCLDSTTTCSKGKANKIQNPPESPNPSLLGAAMQWDWGSGFAMGIWMGTRWTPMRRNRTARLKGRWKGS